MGNKVPNDFKNTRQTFKGAGSNFRKFLVVSRRQMVMNIFEMSSHQVEIVDQPLCSWRNSPVFINITFDFRKTIFKNFSIFANPGPQTLPLHERRT
ncbi:hypothetical protein D3C87_1400610 [compost metagenome]